MKAQRIICPTILITFILSASQYFAQSTGAFVQSFSHKGKNRNVYYYVPPGYNPQQSHKLVTGIYGCGGPVADAASIFRNQLQFLSDSIGAIIISLEGLTENQGYMGMTDDLTFIRAAIDSAIKRYNIHPQEVYLAGFSCNAYVAIALGSQKLVYPFKAVIPIAGAYFESDFTDGSINFKTTTPSCICVGTVDDFFTDNKRLNDSLKAKGAPVLFNPVQGVGHTTFYDSFPKEIMKCFKFFNESSVGIEQKETVEKLVLVYPNPGNHGFFFQFKNTASGLLTITDVYGKNIFKEEMISKEHYFVNTNEWAEGIYFYSFSAGQQKTTGGKLLIQR